MDLPETIAAIPGSPSAIRWRASQYARTADAIPDAVSGLRTAIAETRNHESEALDVLAENADTVADKLETLENRYRVASDALTGFAGDLETAQQQVAPIVTENSEASAQLAYASSRIRQYEQQRLMTTDPTEMIELNEQLIRLHSRANTYRTTVSGAETRFAAIIETLRQSGRDAASRLRTAMDGDGLNDSILDNITGWVQENAEILKAIAVATLGVGAIAPKGVGQVVNLMRANRLAVATNALPQATSRGFAAASRMVTNSFDNVLGGALTTVKTPIPRLTLGESTPAFLRRAVELITAKGGNNADFLRLLQNPTVTGSNATIDAFISLGQTQRFTAALRRRTERDRPGADTRGGDTMTLRVAADPARWMYIPARFPWQGYTRVEEWSAALLAALDDLHDYDSASSSAHTRRGSPAPSTRASTATPTSPNRTSRRRSRASTSGRTSTSTTPSCRALATCGRCGLR